MQTAWGFTDVQATLPKSSFLGYSKVLGHIHVTFTSIMEKFDRSPLLWLGSILETLLNSSVMICRAASTIFLPSKRLCESLWFFYRRHLPSPLARPRWVPSAIAMIGTQKRLHLNLVFKDLSPYSHSVSRT